MGVWIMAVNTTLIEIDEDCLVGGLKETRERLESVEGEVVLDFSSAHRLDVSAVRELEQLASAAESAGRTVRLRGVNVDVYKVLKLTGLSRRFSF
jgi:anti-anti-sigma regulatory factor